MRNRLTCIVLFLTFISFLYLPSPANAWIETGHKIVAMVAWSELTPKTKAAVIEMLKAHPRFDKDLLANAPPGADGDALDRHVFASAAVWPDLIRKQGHPMKTIYNHPSWHFIDIPFSYENQKVPAAKPTTQPGPKDIVEALTKVTADIKNPKISAPDKAIAMCWIAHLVGDIHQPLHAASEYSPQYPTGDEGGNKQLVLRDPPYKDSQVKLHLLWDELPGQFKSDELDVYEAEGLLADKRFSRQAMTDQLAITDFRAWAQDSHDLAVKYAYLDGKLKSAVAPPTPKDDEPAAGEKSASAEKSPSAEKSAGQGELLGTKAKIPGVPPGYVEQAEEIAMKQVVLAGHRLADLLNADFDPQ